jgi:hypothetical protein
MSKCRFAKNRKPGIRFEGQNRKVPAKLETLFGNGAKLALPTDEGR